MPRYNFTTRRYELPRAPWQPSKCAAMCGRTVGSVNSVCIVCTLTELYETEQYRPEDDAA